MKVKLEHLLVNLQEKQYTKVMRGCTPGGSRELPGLSSRELKELKKVMFTQFPQFWKSPEKFEPIWKKCLESVQQLCKYIQARTRKGTNFGEGQGTKIFANPLSSSVLLYNQ